MSFSLFLSILNSMPFPSDQEISTDWWAELPFEELFSRCKWPYKEAAAVSVNLLILMFGQMYLYIGGNSRWALQNDEIWSKNQHSIIWEAVKTSQWSNIIVVTFQWWRCHRRLRVCPFGLVVPGLHCGPCCGHLEQTEGQGLLLCPLSYGIFSLINCVDVLWPYWHNLHIHILPCFDFVLYIDVSFVSPSPPPGGEAAEGPREHAHWSRLQLDEVQVRLAFLGRGYHYLFPITPRETKTWLLISAFVLTVQTSWNVRER